MLLISAKNIKKYYGDRLIIDLPELSVFEGDRIGIVGNNGAGKTTLVGLLTGDILPDSGTVDIRCSYSYISQLDVPKIKSISSEFASKLNIPEVYTETMSGGEKTRFKLAIVMQNNDPLIIADEPTSNLDIEGIEELEKTLNEHKGGLIIISHDRKLLDSCCNSIIEIEDGRIEIYEGNYTRFIQQREERRERQIFEYQQYKREKERLQESMIRISEKSKSTRNAPRRMGNSEARLHKMGGQSAKKNLDNRKKAVQTRIEHLEKKDKPKEAKPVHVDFSKGLLQSRRIISGEGINKSFGEKVIFEDAEFLVGPREKLALVGPNGSGKSTLVKMILLDEGGIKKAKSAKIGYFSQNFEILDQSSTLLESVLKDSPYSETYVRTMLGRLLFRRDDVHKRIEMLSGGEKVKACVAKLILSDNNLLIMDEPTNYLDIASIEALEEAMSDHEGSMLFATHDRALIDRIATGLLIITGKKIVRFDGNYEEYLQYGSRIKKDDSSEILAVLENRLSILVGQLASINYTEEKNKLEQEYFLTAGKIKELRRNK
ncbi:ribosomal protection-like ABC-F family protein [Gudongella oleilytica]|jgi:macrolide transport system ATP-binding/permease protein|uniref:ribosomal protection-like ABC-F family protein n=1 Tax=Gudongella oleilytica TaxID=1582259 RepID=UPI002A36682D|nr:ABC-F type ribosomal protection protein [Gudongella oleilytica]MDY0256793.1 ABC-F type ribosomal protection protein [Gudongella oleilytica]